MGTAFSFNGSGYVTIPTAGRPSAYPLTIVAYINPPDAVHHGGLVYLGNDSAGIGIGIGIQGGNNWDNNGIIFSGLYGNVAWINPTSEQDFTAGSWKMVALTCASGSNPTCYFYMSSGPGNATVQSINANPAHTPSAPNANASIGSEVTTTRMATCSIAKVALFPTALTQAQIDTMAICTTDTAFDSAVLTLTPTGYYKLEDATVTSPIDSSGNNNTATTGGSGTTALVAGPLTAGTAPVFTVGYNVMDY